MESRSNSYFQNLVAKNVHLVAMLHQCCSNARVVVISEDLRREGHRVGVILA